MFAEFQLNRDLYVLSFGWIFVMSVFPAVGEAILILWFAIPLIGLVFLLLTDAAIALGISPNIFIACAALATAFFAILAMLIRAIFLADTFPLYPELNQKQYRSREKKLSEIWAKIDDTERYYNTPFAFAKAEELESVAEEIGAAKISRGTEILNRLKYQIDGILYFFILNPLYFLRDRYMSPRFSSKSEHWRQSCEICEEPKNIGVYDLLSSTKTANEFLHFKVGFFIMCALNFFVLREDFEYAWSAFDFCMYLVVFVIVFFVYNKFLAIYGGSNRKNFLRIAYYVECLQRQGWFLV
jgi:hypothetical protein